MRLIGEWRTVLFRSISNWVALILGPIVGALSTNALVALGVLGFLPLRFQIPGAMVIGLLFYTGPQILARLVHQPKLQAKVEAKIEEKRSGD